MKKVLLILCVFAFTGFSFAQEKTTNSTSVKTEKKNNFDEWSSFLNLTDAQKQQISDIQEKYKAEKSTLRKSGTAADFKKINDKQKQEINSVLTAEQLKKSEEFDAIKEKEKQEKAAIKSAVR